MALKTFKPSSSNISEVQYDPEKKLLHVTFHYNLTTYTHANVPPEIAALFEKDWSAGKYYNHVIKRQSKFPIVKVSK